MVKFDLSKTKTNNEACSVFDTLESEEDFKEFFQQYYSITEKAICEAQGIKLGEVRPIGDTLKVVNSNMHWIISNANPMRRDFAKKIYWFLR